MPTRRLLSFFAAGMLLFGAGTASADVLVYIIEVGRTGTGLTGGTATFEVYLNSGTDTVGAGQLYYYFDNIGQWDAGASSLTGYHSAFPGFWASANGFPGSQADLQIGGAQFGGVQPINQMDVPRVPWTLASPIELLVEPAG